MYFVYHFKHEKVRRYRPHFGKILNNNEMFEVLWQGEGLLSIRCSVLTEIKIQSKVQEALIVLLEC